MNLSEPESEPASPPDGTVRKPAPAPAHKWPGLAVALILLVALYAYMVSQLPDEGLNPPPAATAESSG